MYKDEAFMVFFKSNARGPYASPLFYRNVFTCLFNNVLPATLTTHSSIPCNFSVGGQPASGQIQAVLTTQLKHMAPVQDYKKHYQTRKYWITPPVHSVNIIDHMQ
jgi:hypothetical protein